MSTSLQRRTRTAHSPTSNTHHHDSLSPDSSIEDQFSPKIGASSSSPQQQQRRRKKRGGKTWLQRCRWCVTLILGVLLATIVVLSFQKIATIFLAGGRPIQLVKLPVPNVDIDVPSATEWPLVHIINTRFMQEQGQLTALAQARFRLFMTFCYPTMIYQTSQNFFWIIKTDPQFAKTALFQEMVQAVQGYPNIYLVASNQNFLVPPNQGGSWRDGAEGMDLLQSEIYTGNITELHQAIALRNERPILETRLDADDGLHLYYIQYIQMVALKRFQPEGDTDPNSIPRWLYWCTRRHLEWHSSLYDEIPSNNGSPNNNNLVGDIDISKGILNPVQHSKLCITPGITVGYNVGVDAKDVPVHSHDLLYAKLANSTECFAPSRSKHKRHRKSKSSAASCLVLVEDLLFCALRSRTWTSAGMRNVPLEVRYVPRPELVEKLWQLLEERFAINQTTVADTQTFLYEHQRQIAYENLLGQCTTGHSCKDQAKQELQQYMEENKHELPSKVRAASPNKP